MSELTTNEVDPIEVEVIEQADDHTIVKMMTGQMIKDYVYSIK